MFINNDSSGHFANLFDHVNSVLTFLPIFHKLNVILLVSIILIYIILNIIKTKKKRNWEDMFLLNCLSRSANGSTHALYG